MDNLESGEIVNPNDNDQSHETKDAIMRAVSFDVVAIVGKASLTLSDIENMAQGEVIPLSSKLTDVVTLQLNGVEIARGELVSVGDNFAVKLTHVTE